MVAVVSMGLRHTALMCVGAAKAALSCDACSMPMFSSIKHSVLLGACAGRVFIHPGSVNFNVGRFDSGWLVYTDMVSTSKLFVRESSMVPVYALLLFGGRLRSHVHTQQGCVTC